MSIIDKISGDRFKDVIEFLDKQLNDVGRGALDTCKALLDAVISLDAPKVWTEVRTAVESIVVHIDAAMDSFTQATGLEVTTEILSQGIEALTGFIRDCVEGLAEVPIERWVHVAMPLVLAGALFATGNAPLAGRYLAMSFMEFGRLIAEGYASGANYSMPEELRNVFVEESNMPYSLDQLSAEMKRLFDEDSRPDRFPPNSVRLPKFNSLFLNGGIEEIEPPTPGHMEFE